MGGTVPEIAPVCAGTTVNLSAPSNGNIETINYIWFNGKDNRSVSIVAPETTTTYTVTMTMEDDKGHTLGRVVNFEVTVKSESECGVLPIELTSFTADCDGTVSHLQWTTASERNNDYFIIEHSDDAVNFSEIARVAGAGNSIEQLDYTYNDYSVNGGENYYRLVQVDYDGTRSASEIIVTNCDDADFEEPEVQAFPNPFNGELTLHLTNFDNKVATIEVYNMLGKLVAFDKVDAPQNSHEVILNLSNLSNGAYTVRVSAGDTVINRQVVKN